MENFKKFFTCSNFSSHIQEHAFILEFIALFFIVCCKIKYHASLMFFEVLLYAETGLLSFHFISNSRLKYSRTSINWITIMQRKTLIYRNFKFKKQNLIEFLSRILLLFIYRIYRKLKNRSSNYWSLTVSDLRY